MLSLVWSHVGLWSYLSTCNRSLSDTPSIRHVVCACMLRFELYPNGDYNGLPSFPVREARLLGPAGYVFRGLGFSPVDEWVDVQYERFMNFVVTSFIVCRMYSGLSLAHPVLIEGEQHCGVQVPVRAPLCQYQRALVYALVFIFDSSSFSLSL